MRSRNCLPFASTWVHSRFFGRVRVAHHFSFVVLLCVLPCCDVPVMISAYKRCSIRVYLQVFVGGLMSYLCYLYLFTYSGTKHILTIWVTWRVSYKEQELPCFLVRFVLLIFTAFCVVLCAQCCQCLWIVHSSLPLQLSLKYLFMFKSFSMYLVFMIFFFF